MAELEKLTGVAFWPLVLGTFTMSVLLAVVFTWPVCVLLLWRYRRSVKAGMRSSTAPPPVPGRSAPSARPPVSPAPAIAIEDARPDGFPPLIARANHRARRAQVVFVLASLLFGLGSTTVYHLVARDDRGPLGFLLLALIMGWLVVPTVIATGITDRRTKAGLWVGYPAAVLVLGVSSAPGRAELLGVLLLVVAVPGLFVLATATRTLRGAAWLVAPALVALGVAAAAAYPPLLYLRYGVAFDRLMWTLLAAAVAVLALTALYGWTVARLYAHKWASDETLLTLQWWFVLALTQALLLGTQGTAAALLALAPFAAMVLFLLAVALVRRPSSSTPPARLLLLRTFGSRRRSSRLLRDLTVHWRWIGSVELITGTDLATEVLEPHEFLDYLRGRLRRHFVRDVADLEQRLAELDLLADLDGRYRVNEMRCHDDTWRPTLHALVLDVDVVLIDLRGLTAHHTGVVHELEQLVALLPLDRVVALSDATTDQRVLRWALGRAAALAPPDAPVHHDHSPVLRTVRLAGRRSPDLGLVLDAVGRAAAPKLPGAGAPVAVAGDAARTAHR